MTSGASRLQVGVGQTVAVIERIIADAASVACCARDTEIHANTDRERVPLYQRPLVVSLNRVARVRRPCRWIKPAAKTFFNDHNSGAKRS